jgi:hypothetical protein
MTARHRIITPDMLDGLAAYYQAPDEARAPLIYAAICAKCFDDGQRKHLI